jgi:hypothetical protein
MSQAAELRAIMFPGKLPHACTAGRVLSAAAHSGKHCSIGPDIRRFRTQCHRLSRARVRSLRFAGLASAAEATTCDCAVCQALLSPFA